VSTFDEATAVRRTGDGSYEMRPDARFAVPPSGQGPPAVNGRPLQAVDVRHR
jgi:hypothetical protein